ncbi:MAG: alpha/beta hydrolase-fold protein [Gemmatimonadota bacterium]|nr:alpha/beta hydrolase-fold protein [Gemmatimonadota bacterium]
MKQYLILTGMFSIANFAGATVSTLSAQQASSATVPAHDSLTIGSVALHEARPINVHLPADYRAGDTTRFPVLYMPDGGMDEDFPHVVKTVDSLTSLSAIRPVIIVGIPNTERRRDLTGPTRVSRDSAVAPHVGGSAAFRRFVEHELVPAIDTRYRTTHERTIIGESLAGLFIVETFLRDPGTFDHYIAFDPSLWWNHGALVDSASVLLRRGAMEHAPHATLYIAASSDDIDGNTGKLADVLHAAALPRVALIYVARTELTHPTIFLGLAPSALIAALH